MESWILDLRFALRRMRGRPLHAALAVLTLALGVGGAAAIAGVVRGLLVRPLPYSHEERVGIFWGLYDWSEKEFLTLRPDFPGFSAVAAYTPLDALLERPGAPTRLVPGIAASAELFAVLGTRPLLGRGFERGDDVQGAEAVAVIGYGLFRDLGADPAIVGQRLELGGKLRTVVGVMPRGFWFPAPDVEVWVAQHLDPGDGSGDYALVGRLAPGVAWNALPSYLERTTRSLGEHFQFPAGWDLTKNAHVTPIRDALVGSLRPALLATLVAMALILLIACANVAALTLAQLEGRSGELASRVALGADRARLLQQLTAEALVVGLAAGAAGAALATASFHTLVAALPLGAWGAEARLGPGIVLVAIAAALGAALLVALPAIVSLGRSDLRAVLATSRTGGVARRGGRLESSLVVAEVALAVLLAAGAALLLRSVTNLYAVDPGIEARGLAVVDVVLPGNGSAAEKHRQIDELVDALGALPGVRSAAATHKLPLRGEGSSTGIQIEGRRTADETTTYFRIVTPGYLETMGLPLVEGRTLRTSDRASVPTGENGETPVVVNRALAERYFPHEDAVGHVLTDGFGVRERIVGVVGNAAEARLSDPPVPARYWLLDHVPFLLDRMSFVLRVAPGIDPAALLAPARKTIERLAPAAAVRETTTMTRVVDEAVGPVRQLVRLLGLLSLLAVVLGAVGVYGVLAHFVTRRKRDWAIRMALGAAPAQVVASVVRHGAALIAVGLALGLAASAAASRLLASLLYEVRGTDPAAFAGAGLVLLVVGLGAALLPAWRAGRTQPARLLREV